MELSLTLLLILFKSLLSSKNRGGKQFFHFHSLDWGKNFFIDPPLFFKMEIIFIYRIKKNILGRRI
jgi:hypothetical protein